MAGQTKQDNVSELPKVTQQRMPFAPKHYQGCDASACIFYRIESPRVLLDMEICLAPILYIQHDYG